MVQEEGVNLQRGMNYQLKGGLSVILMSIRPGAPYADRIENGGKTLIYEGHDISKKKDFLNPKLVDQPYKYPSGKLTQNGLFYNAALDYKKGVRKPELVKVYEKIRSGIWTYNGIFKLIDAWKENSKNRMVYKFKLIIAEKINHNKIMKQISEIENTRIIPTSVKLEVWKRDKGKCIKCGSDKNLHFDHIIPYSKGGSSLVAENIQLLCAKHNLEKRDKIR
jgi:hypothetical protein